MADADKQKEMDAKKAEVEVYFIINLIIPNATMVTIINPTKMMIINAINYDHNSQVRARLEAQAAGKKNKKGFMTPERKKKLRVITNHSPHVDNETQCSYYQKSLWKFHNFLFPAFAAKESS